MIPEVYDTTLPYLAWDGKFPAQTFTQIWSLSKLNIFDWSLVKRVLFVWVLLFTVIVVDGVFLPLQFGQSRISRIWYIVLVVDIVCSNGDTRDLCVKFGQNRIKELNYFSSGWWRWLVIVCVCRVIFMFNSTLDMFSWIVVELMMELRDW